MVIIRAPESILQSLDSDWERIRLHTGWKLETCFKPVYTPLLLSSLRIHQMFFLCLLPVGIQKVWQKMPHKVILCFIMNLFFWRSELGPCVDKITCNRPNSAVSMEHANIQCHVQNNDTTKYIRGDDTMQAHTKPNS